MEINLATANPEDRTNEPSKTRDHPRQYVSTGNETGRDVFCVQQKFQNVQNESYTTFVLLYIRREERI